MQYELTCNQKDTFSFKDIKKSNLVLRVPENSPVVKAKLGYYLNKEEKEFISLTTTTLRKHFTTFDKRYFDDKKKEYHIILLDENGENIEDITIKFKKKGFLLAAFLLGAALIVGGFFLFGEDVEIPGIHNGILDGDGEVGDGEFTKDTQALIDALNKQTKYLNIKISSCIKVKNNEGYFRIVNSNKDMDIQVVVYSYNKETKEINENEILYVSPLLHTNKNVEKGKLKKELASGTYSAIAMFNAYDLDGNKIGEAGQEIILEVE